VGRVIADRKEFGHGFQEINKVMDYSGTSLLSRQTTGPKGGERRSTRTTTSHPDGTRSSTPSIFTATLSRGGAPCVFIDATLVGQRHFGRR
jgi:hypothetical protein